MATTRKTLWAVLWPILMHIIGITSLIDQQIPQILENRMLTVLWAWTSRDGGPNCRTSVAWPNAI